MFEGRSNLWTELQCGSYIFMDGEYAALKGSRGEPYLDFEQSLFVLTTVMSVAGAGRAILDAGLKSYSLEKGLPTIHGPNVGRLIRASDEHGIVALAPGASLRLGAKIKLAPSHCDPTDMAHVGTGRKQLTQGPLCSLISSLDATGRRVRLHTCTD